MLQEFGGKKKRKQSDDKPKYWRSSWKTRSWTFKFCPWSNRTNLIIHIPNIYSSLLMASILGRTTNWTLKSSNRDEIYIAAVPWKLQKGQPNFSCPQFILSISLISSILWSSSIRQILKFWFLIFNLKILKTYSQQLQLYLGRRYQGLFLPGRSRTFPGENAGLLGTQNWFCCKCCGEIQWKLGHWFEYWVPWLPELCW